MPRRTDIQKILIIGSGPIVIGQACEFDYSGTQACKSLKEEGYRIILLNSNPATIMTDPDIADATYIEPMTLEILERIIIRETPHALLPTLGGQTALNLAQEAHKAGLLSRHNVEMIGVCYDAINRAEDREEFSQIVAELGLQTAPACFIQHPKEAASFLETHGCPLVVRPCYTLGGAGGGIIEDVSEFQEKIEDGLRQSPVTKVLVEKSLAGWKEFEIEIMRDRADNVVVICSIENIDPMGVHTGDSLTVAPALTLSDVQYQRMRNAAIAIIRRIGVETGGANIQFAVNPLTNDMVVIELNPRVSRSSALASKATGFPIARVAAKLAVGYTLDEIPNSITKKTPAAFEPSLDFCVVKVPRFAFDKFDVKSPKLTTSMYSVGEVMGIGRTFAEALQKACRSHDANVYGLYRPDSKSGILSDEELCERIRVPHPDRLFDIYEALRRGISCAEIESLSNITGWFIDQISTILQIENACRAWADAQKRDIQACDLDGSLLKEACEWGFSDLQLASIFGLTSDEIATARAAHDIKIVFKTVDTCSGEFEAYTPYFYSSYGDEDDITFPKDKRRIIVLGSGPNRIGQGIEFDYCCVHASTAIKAMGHESIMINSNPETVSTDNDCSTRLYFEPLVLESVIRVCKHEQADGVMVQFGGQIGVNLAKPLAEAGINVLGTSVSAISKMEDRGLFREYIKSLGFVQPDGIMASSIKEAQNFAKTCGYPLIVRPSYVLGGQSMEVVYDDEALGEVFDHACQVSEGAPILVDRFLEDALEVDVDALCGPDDFVIIGLIEHVQAAGVHSGDSTGSYPHQRLPAEAVKTIEAWTKRIAQDLDVRGLLNIQYAIQGSSVFILEVNPRASRTIPFMSKVRGVSWAQQAARIMCGERILEMPSPLKVHGVAVKEPVFPLSRFPSILPGSEMRSTGEVMAWDRDFGTAFIKAQLAVYQRIATSGGIFISVREAMHNYAPPLAQLFHELGFQLYATVGTAEAIKTPTLPVTVLNRIHEGKVHVLDLLQDGKIQLIVNIPSNHRSIRVDEARIRSVAVSLGVPILSNVSTAQAYLQGLVAYRAHGGLNISPIQDMG